MFVKLMILFIKFGKDFPVSRALSFYIFDIKAHIKRKLIDLQALGSIEEAKISLFGSGCLAF